MIEAIVLEFAPSGKRNDVRVHGSGFECANIWLFRLPTNALYF